MFCIVWSHYKTKFWKKIIFFSIFNVIFFFEDTAYIFYFIFWIRIFFPVIKNIIQIKLGKLSTDLELPISNQSATHLKFKYYSFKIRFNILKCSEKYSDLKYEITYVYAVRLFRNEKLISKTITT